jgi:hypothetical protein
MLRQARSRTETRNPNFVEQPREREENNLAWGERAARAMAAAGPEAWTYVALLGGSDTLSFRMRLAQAHLRRDMLPSYWSEAILVELEAASFAGASAVHVPLLQPEGPGFATRTNGVVSRPLTDFGDSVRYPNIALIAMPVPQAEIVQRVADFKRSRSTLDALEHVLRWLAFSWGVARTGNPLHENYGLPSACMLETVCAAAGLDLTPGLESRASCPEAIWSAAAYWQDYFQQAHGKMPIGRFCHPHYYPITEPGENRGPPPAAAPTPSAGPAPSPGAAAPPASPPPRGRRRKR